MSDKTLHMIGNAHRDPVWLWQWPEGFQEVKATFRSVLDLMQECDDFLFTARSAALYEWIEQNDPAMFAEIKQRVAEGRWEIAGGWWIEPDCNLPGGESLVRQGLYGQRYFRDKLGVTATVGYNVDSFGHRAMLPQLLRKCGMTSYMFMRPQPHEMGLPSRLFWWESDDGSRVLPRRWNRRAENLLLTAEKLAVLARHCTGLPYPADFDRAWKDVLFNQFHDILGGTSIEPAYTDARDSYGEAITIATRHLNNAVQALAWNIDVEPCEECTSLAVFNPHSWPARLNVEMEYGRLPQGAGLVDDQGAPVALQIVRSLATVSGGRHRLSFVADLPVLGYRVYRLMPHCPPPDVPPVQADDRTMENERFRLEIDPHTGAITRLFDKREQVEVLRGPAAQAVVIADPSDTWGHCRQRFDQVAGLFAAQAVRLVEHGPVKAVIRVVSTYGRSTLMQDIAMYREREGIDVHVTVDWREQFALLKLRFPLNVACSPQATYEIPYGHIHRPADGNEEPGQSWIDLTGVTRDRDRGDLYGLSILNDGKYSFDVTENTLSLTVLRSPIYAHHDPYVPRPDESYAFIDQGIQRFTYTLLPHAGSWEEAGTVRRAAELNQGPIALIASGRQGHLPLQDSYIQVAPDNIIVSAIKKAEDNDDIIVRCYETDKVATTATIRLPLWNRVIAAHFAPCEIKTFRVPLDAALQVAETNLLEWTEDVGR